MSELYDKMEALKKLTGTNLQKQFESVHDFAESSIHYANRCDVGLALKELVFTEIAVDRLRQDALRRYQDGFITKDEYLEISDLSLGLVVRELSEEVTDAIAKTCECAKL